MSSIVRELLIELSICHGCGSSMTDESYDMHDLQKSKACMSLKEHALGKAFWRTKRTEVASIDITL